MLKNYVLVLLYILVVVDTLFCQKDTLSVYIAPIEVSSQTDYLLPNIITIDRNTLNVSAASFDDPTRLLMKSGGISLSNDQSNAVIVNGMPAHYIQWTLHDIDIVNPNHLSNAGTLSDIRGAVSGGVNMVAGQMISGGGLAQAGSLFNSQAIAGTMRMQLDSMPSYGQASLLGFEGGYSNNGLRIGGRYSFTGLLSDIGVDFGGEAIKFQDVNLGYIKKWGRFLLKINSIQGASSNEFTPDSSGIDAKSFQVIDYMARASINTLELLGDRWQWKAAYSNRLDERSAEGLIPTISPIIIDDFTRFKHSRLHMSMANSSHKDWQWGLKIRNDIYRDTVCYRSQKFNQNLSQWIGIPYLSHTMTLQDFNVYTSFQPTYHFGSEEISPDFTINISSILAANQTLGIALHHISQVQDAFTTIFMDDNYLTKSLGTTLQYRLKNDALNVGVDFFYNKIRDIPSNGQGYVVFNTLDLVPNSNFDMKSKARTYGTTINIRKSWKNRWDLSSNLSLFTSDYEWLGEWFGATQSFGHVFNISVAKSHVLSKSDNKYLRWNITTHLRGGMKQFDLGEGPYTTFVYKAGPTVTLKDYFRVDARLVYQTPQSTWSLDIQNVTNNLNDAFVYRDLLSQEQSVQLQLGLLPVLSYRRYF